MCMARLIVCLAIFYALAALGGPSPPGRDAIHVAPGDYAWHPEVSPSGLLVVIVSLDEQRVYVYRNGIAIGFAAISSGRRGHETPPGIYTILEKDRDHHSNLYDNAPMPFMERLTWDGVALHGGRLPGYPALHGCVRLPKAFAEFLFAITQPGETVVIANSSVSPTDALGASGRSRAPRHARRALKPPPARTTYPLHGTTTPPRRARLAFCQHPRSHGLRAP